MDTHHRSDGLVSGIILSTSVVLDHFTILGMNSFSDSINFLIDLSPMVIPFLTSSGYRELDTRRMPGTDTGYFSETFVCLPGQFLAVPSRGDTLEPFSFRHSDRVDHFILSEDTGDRDRLLEVSSGELYFLSNTSSVHLDLHDVRLLLSLS